MKSTFSGIILSGAIQLDEQVDLADQSRVHVTIVPVNEQQGGWHQAIHALDELRKNNPLHTQGQRFSREQLHERD